MGAYYNGDNASVWAKEIADEIKYEIKQKNFARYKLLVHCVIGENKGAGLNLANRCFWDGNTDAFAKETFENKSLFAVATCYGIYFY